MINVLSLLDFAKFYMTSAERGPTKDICIGFIWVSGFFFKKIFKNWHFFYQ